MSAPLITADQVVLDLATADRGEATRLLAETLLAAGRVADLDGFLADVQVREQQMATGLPGGIAIPHARSAHVTTSSLAFARPVSGIDWGAEDGPASLIFLIAVPEGGDADNLAILAKLARKLMRSEFKDALLSVTDVGEAADLIEREVVNS